MFFLLYKQTDDGVFDDFPKISDHFPKISEDFPKLSRRPDERSRTFSENFRKFPKIFEDFWRLPKTIEEDPKMFWWYTNYFKYNLRDKLDISEINDIFTCEDIISSHVRISYRFYQFVTTRYTTDFYIIKVFQVQKQYWWGFDGRIFVTVIMDLLPPKKRPMISGSKIESANFYLPSWGYRILFKN